MGKSKFALLIIVILFIPFMLLGCGGSGGGSGSGDTSSSMGTAAVFIKDDPTAEYDSIILCISKATLEPGSVTLFESEECHEIDLLDHQEKPFLLTVKDIPAGKYNQIRLNVEYIITDGGPCDEPEPPLPIKIPSGVIKVNPQGPIRVKSGDKLAFEIDIHAKRSLNLHVAGNSQKCIFRPVIIAAVTNLRDIPSKNKCPRILDGTITEITEDAGEVTEFKLRLSHDSGCQIKVKVNEDTIVFDEDGIFRTPDALEVGQKVKVKGEILEDASLLASVIAIGDLIKLYGTVNEIISKSGDLVFEMKLTYGQVVVDETINVVVDGQTLILKDCNTEVDRDAIKPGIGVRAIGKISKGSLLSVVLFLEDQKNYGIIKEMIPNGAGYDLKFIPAGAIDPIDVFLPDEAEVALEDDGEIDKETLAELVDCEPRKARITFNETYPEEADFVEVKDEVIEGKIKTTDPESRKIELQGALETIIEVQQFATIIKNGDKINFKELKYGDEIRVFGLAACPEEERVEGDDVDFYGFVVVVIDFEKKGDEGCSQGYWKNHSHSWGPTGYYTTDKYNDIFGVDYDKTKTLLEALDSGGGGENALGRQAVAALLNAAHPRVDYYYTEYEVIDIVKEAYDRGNFENAKNRLENHNDRSNCPLN